MAVDSGSGDVVKLLRRRSPRLSLFRVFVLIFCFLGGLALLGRALREASRLGFSLARPRGAPRGLKTRRSQREDPYHESTKARKDGRIRQDYPGFGKATSGTQD